MIDTPKSGSTSRPSICINALLLQNHLGGIGNYTYQLAKIMTADHPEWEFYLLVHKGIAKFFRDIPNLHIIEVGITGRWGKLFFLHLIFSVRAMRYDLFHSVGNMGLAFGSARQVITIHDTYEHSSPERFSFFKRTLMRLLISVSGKKAQHILTDSASSARDIAKYYPALADKVSVVYLGSKFPVLHKGSAVNRKGFIFVGTIEPGKNLSLVLEAFAVWRRGREGRLSVIGASGWKQTALPSLIHKLGIEDSVDFLGYVSDEKLLEFYSCSLATIQASNYEGFGLPVIEAMACGCPVIAAHNSGLIEAGGESALFFPTNDKAALVDRMNAVADDPILREACINKGFKHAASFSWETTASQTAGIYAKYLRKE